MNGGLHLVKMRKMMNAPGGLKGAQEQHPRMVARVRTALSNYRTGAFYALDTGFYGHMQPPKLNKKDKNRNGADIMMC